MLPWLLYSLILNRDVGLWARNGHGAFVARCPLSRAKRKTSTRNELFQVLNQERSAGGARLVVG
jgi:hypothetical protein